MSQSIVPLVLLLFLPQSQPASKPVSARTASSSSVSISVLRFSELFVPEGDHLRISDRLKSLHGKRVRVAGFIAEMEEPLHGAFYLCEHPVHGDESGGSTGDLPVNSLRVIVPEMEGKVVPPHHGSVSVTGVIDVGFRQEPDGSVSFVRLTTDPIRRKPSTAGQPRKDAKPPIALKKNNFKKPR